MQPTSDSTVAAGTYSAIPGQPDWNLQERIILDGYPDLQIIAEAGDGEEAITLARLLKPDVIVMDVNMPRLDGIEATRRIREEMPETLIVGLSVNEHVVKSMKAAGAVAFLTKESAADHLYEAIGAVTRKVDVEFEF